MPLGSHLLPLLLLPLLPLQDGSVTADDSAAVEVAEDGSALEEPTPPPVAQPTEHSAAWLGIIGEPWRSLDDPGARTLPDPLRQLPGKREAVFESLASPRFFIVRHLSEVEDAIDAFVRDEEAMNRQGELIPLADRVLEGANGETLVFDCEWTWNSLTARVSAIYVPIESGRVRSLWLVTTEDTPFETLQAELEAALMRHDEPSGPAPPASYSALLNDHAISFDLRITDEIRLQPVEMVEADHADFVHQILEENTEFLGSHTRQWQDEDHGTKLSYQIVVHDLNLGPDPAFVHWLSSVFQLFLREDEEEGDVPVELIHLENARTEIVDDETLKRHFVNNRRASQAGVILEVVLPRSPYARARRLSWVRLERTGRFPAFE